MKKCRVGGELFHVHRQTDGQTDMTKLIDAFRSSANAPKNFVSENDRLVKSWPKVNLACTTFVKSRSTKL
jgi:hypothetical protein